MVITTEYRWTYADRSKHPGANVVWCCPGHRRGSEKALRAEGYRDGLVDALEEAIRRIDGVSTGATCSERLSVLLVYVEDTGHLPGKD